MALERVPADIRRDGGIARMSDPKVCLHFHCYLSSVVICTIVYLCYAFLFLSCFADGYDKDVLSLRFFLYISSDVLLILLLPQ